MTHPLSRRDFLRLAATLSLLPLAPSVNRLAKGLFQPVDRPNIIIILFDALSARHLSLYGYPRKTTPNLERFAQRSTVFHQHHSAANFTTPSTASLFTGAYPFTHRVFAINGMVANRIRPYNLLNTLHPAYPEAALVQNMYADLVLYQLREHLEVHYGSTAFVVAGKTIYDHLFPNDAVYGAKTYDQFLFNPKENPGSLFGALPLDIFRQINKRSAEEAWSKVYPDGMPFLDWAKANFTLEQVIDGAQNVLSGLKAPFFSYLHFMPPHAPYRPRKEFIGLFKDGWKPVKKDPHPLSEKLPQAHLNELRREYDEFVAHLDAEFGRLLDWMDVSGLLDTSYVIFTADHGELFERGEAGHVSPLLFEEIIHVPLVVHVPGQTSRQDVRTLTSNVDIFRSLAGLASLPVPAILEGAHLPGLGLPNPPGDRPVWAVEAKRNAEHAPLSTASMALIRWPYKLIGYWGYTADDIYEFYDLENDPEELENLIDSHPLSREFRSAMEEKRREVDAQYQVR
jgi:arylsulfatase A-like enzyme